MTDILLEYKVVVSTPGDVERALNLLAEMGWRLVAVTMRESVDERRTHMFLYLERPRAAKTP